MRIFAFLLAALVLAGCQSASVNPYILPGVSELPEPVLSNEELRDLIGIVDTNDNPSLPGHADRVEEVAIRAHASGSAGPSPFDVKLESTLEGKDATTYPPATWRIVNRSRYCLILPLSDGMYLNSEQGRWIEHHVNVSVVAAAGNYGTENQFASYENEDLEHCKENAEYIEYVYPRVRDGHKLLYVASLDPSGAARWHQSTGCGGIESICVYAPWAPDPRGDWWGGTSAAAPMVTAALASVLAVHPHLSGPDLIRLAKECADKIEGLPGLGTINVLCMNDRASIL